MRLIDADALAKELMHEGLGYQYNRVANAPTVDAVPVRHGKWIKHMKVVHHEDFDSYTPWWQCSECGQCYDPTFANICNYCYYCGAKMDGEREEE